MKGVCAVVNARLDTADLPGKLIRPFAGTTLLQVALEKLDRTHFFETRYVATLDGALKPIASRFENIQVLDWITARYERGAPGRTDTFPHYLDMQSQYIFVLDASFPFLTVKTIQRAVHCFQKTDFASYLSGVESRDWIFDGEGNALTNSDPRNVTTNVGQLFHKATNAFHIIQRDFYRRHGRFWSLQQNDPHIIPIPEEEAVQVSGETEFMYAEFCYGRHEATKSAS